MVGRLFICCLMFSMNVAAQENKLALMDQIHQMQQYLDSAAKRKVDARYIEVPAKPWRVILRYKETAFDVDYSNSAGYNLVPLRGLAINAMAMPTLSVYNRVKVHKYDLNYELSEEPTDGYGQWDPKTHTWANGKTHKPLPLDDEERKWRNDADAWATDAETEYSALRLNIDLRLGIAYNWRNYFIGAQAQFNKFNYKKDLCRVNLYDAYARVALGIRL